MENKQYQEYLNSFAWKAIKKVKLELNPNCECCEKSATTVHHLSYDRIWKEDENDIVSICEECHKECHFVNWYQIKNSESELRKRFEEIRESRKTEKYIPNLNEIKENYEIIWDKVYYISWGIKTEIDWVEIQSFEILNEVFSRDNNFVYFEDAKLDIITPKNIKLLWKYFIIDKDTIFFQSVKIDWYYITSTSYPWSNRNLVSIKSDKSINNIDINTFEILNNYYSRDKKNIYYWWEKIKNIDVNSFSIIDEDYWKDKTNIYFESKKIDWVNLESFKIIESPCSKDNTFCYYWENKIVWADINTFIVKNNFFSLDINFVYYRWKRIEWTDPHSFSFIKYYYWKDKNFVYFQSNKIELADPNSFIVLDSLYTKDKNYVYINRKVINWADANSFELIDKYNGKDKNHIYNSFWKIIE